MPENRGRASLMGIRQTETNFEFSADMEFDSDLLGAEAGIALFQKDNNYLAFTVQSHNQGYDLTGHIHSTGSIQSDVIKRIPLKEYQGRVTLGIDSRDGLYELGYSLDGGLSWRPFTTIPGNQFISKGYTGAYLGVFATSRGYDMLAFADFDSVRYEPKPRCHACENLGESK
jgi:alpha-N-arabinofuranosidase